MLERTLVVLLLFMGCWGQWGALGRRVASRVVNTKHGALRGFIVAPADPRLQPVEVFLGVPFASPPVGTLRFMPPVSPTQWRGVRPADAFGPVCPQRPPDVSNETAALARMPRGRLHYLKRLLGYLRNQSEDCLYLNIYAPAKVGRDLGLLPVMVYIHGESYEWNSGNPYDGTVLASYGDVVVVTINFRLGILGFLRTGDDAVRGNYGLLDQVGALTWIAQNIEEFGGDRNNVTLIGQGYGAACVNFLMLSPVARGYFHRAIMHSGSALSPWALVKDPVKFTRQVAQAVDCPASSDRDLVACLRQRPLTDFLRLAIREPDYLTAFGPTVDGIVVPNEPQQLMQNLGDGFSAYDLLLGTTKIEALSPFTAEDMQFGFEADRRDRILRAFLSSTYEFHLNEIFALLVNEYTDWTRPIQHPINTRDATMEILGDAVVVAPLVLAADMHATHRQNTFLYNFAYQSRDGDYPRRLGCFSGEELPYLFGAPLVDQLGHFHRNYTKAERTLSEAVMTYWTNFARTGDPNQPGRQMQDAGKNRSRFNKVTWPQYDTTHEKYLAIGMRPKMRHHYRAHKLSVWLRLIPVIHQEDKENTSPLHHHIYRHPNATSLSAGGPRPAPVAPPPPRPAFLPPPPGLGRANQTARPSSTGPGAPSQGPEGAANGSRNATERLKAEAIHHGSYSTALSVTIAVGCSLLILNILIFAGVYYQRDKNRLEAKMQKKHYKLKKVNEELSQQASAANSQKPPLPRAPPPSPVGQSSRHREALGGFPSAALVAQTLNTLKTPPKVPPKPPAGELNVLTEVQPLLAAQNACGGGKVPNKNPKMQEIRV